MGRPGLTGVNSNPTGPDSPKHDTACVFLRLSTPSADIIGYGGVWDQEVVPQKVPHVNRPGPVQFLATTKLHRILPRAPTPGCPQLAPGSLVIGKTADKETHVPSARVLHS